MLCAEADASAASQAEGRRHGGLSAALKPVLGELVGDLVVADAGEVGEHDFADRAQAGYGRPQHRPHDRPLGDRPVSYAPAPQALVQTYRSLEHTAGRADVLADEHHVRVVLELIAKGPDHGFPVCDLIAHCGAKT